MPIPNAVEFLGNTGESLWGSLSGIGDAIDGYHRSAGRSKVDELYILYKEIEHWQKDHKPGRLFASKLQREAAVAILKNNVTDELDVEMAGLGSALKNYGVRKSDGTPTKDFKSLETGYHLERKTYLADKKSQAPFSGTLVHDHKDATNRFKTLTPQEFEAIGQKTKVRMYFLNKIQRLRLLATCTDRGWVDIGGNLLSTKVEDMAQGIGHPKECQIYAMDRYGNVFVDFDNIGHAVKVLGATRTPAKAARDDRGQTNHSSFCAGREVICAGNIFFWKGQLIHIDNGSGHYAPTRAALRLAVEGLANQGTDLDKLRVSVYLSDDDGYDHFKARTFLQNAQHGDWPEQDWGANQDNVFRRCPNFKF